MENNDHVHKRVTLNGETRTPFFLIALMAPRTKVAARTNTPEPSQARTTKSKQAAAAARKPLLAKENQIDVKPSSGTSSKSIRVPTPSETDGSEPIVVCTIIPTCLHDTTHVVRHTSASAHILERVCQHLRHISILYPPPQFA